MKNTINKMLAITLTLILVLSCAGITGYAENSGFNESHIVREPVSYTENGMKVTIDGDRKLYQKLPDGEQGLQEGIQLFAAGDSGGSGPSGGGGGGSSSSVGSLRPYLATVGDYATPIRVILEFEEFGWTTAKLTPKTGSTRELDFYSCGEGGALFLDGLAAGTYDIEIDGEALDRPLKVLALDERYVETAWGLGINEGRASWSYEHNGNSYWWLQNIFEGGYVHPSFAVEDKPYYFIHADGSVYVTVCGVNLRASDITGATLTAENGSASLDKVIPGTNHNSKLLREYYLKLNVTGNLDTDGIFDCSTELEVDFADGVTGNTDDTWELSRNMEENWLIDTSRIDQLEVDIIPVNIPEDSLPQSMDIHVQNSYSAPEPYFTVNAELANGRYTVELEAGRYYWENYSLYFKFNPDDTFDRTYEISAGNVNRILVQRGGSDEYWEIYGGNEIEILPNVNGQEILVYNDFWQNSPFRDNINLSLADASFMPVSGVSITRSNTLNNSGMYTTHTDVYTINSSVSLTQDATYYLMNGSFPAGKLKAKAYTQTEKDSRGYVHLEETITGKESFYLNVEAPSGKTITPSEWIVELTNIKTEAKITPVLINRATGTNTRAYFETTTNIPVGLYSVSVYKGGTEIIAQDYDGEYYFYNDLLVCTSAPAGLKMNYSGLSWNESSGSRVFSFYADGFAPSTSQISGLKVSFYSKTNSFLNPAPVSTVTLPAATPSGGSVWFNMPVASLGLEPGNYWAVISDSNGAAILANTFTLTRAVLSSDPNAVSLTGSVTLRDNAANNIIAELWQNGSKIAEKNILNGSFSFDGLTKGAAYTLKIPEGNGWKAYERTVTLSSTQNLEITLESSVPTYTISGKVTLDDTPVAGYVVRLYDAANLTASVATAVTAADGSYSLTAIDGAYVIIGKATADYNEVKIEGVTVDGAAVTGKDLALVEKPYIEGTVKQGETVKGGAYVYLYEISGNSEIYVKSATANSSGLYKFKDLKENTPYVVKVSTSAYFGLIYIDTTEGGKVTADIDVKPYVTLSGTVTSDGKPVSSVYVILNNGNYTWWAYTNANGVYSFSNIESGLYEIKVEEGLTFAGYTDNVDLTDGAAAKTHNITLSALPTYDVTFDFNDDVLTEDDYFALVVCRNNPYYQYFEVDDTNEIKLPNGNYGYYYYYNDVYGYGSFTVNGAEATVDFTLPDVYTISGTVTDAEGEPVANAAVSANGSMYANTVTDADGKYKFKTTANGSVTVSARHATAGYGSIAAFTIEDADDKDITLAVNSVTVTVTNGTAPVSGANVYAGNISGYTDNNGSVTFYNVPIGQVWISAYKYGFIDKNEVITVSGGSDETVELALSEDANLAYSFTLKLSDSEITYGGYVSLTPSLKYTGTGTPEAGGTITLSLPAGVEVDGTNPYDGGYIVSSFEDSLPSIRLTVNETVANLSELYINANYSTALVHKYDYRYLTVVNATLSSPEIVKADTNFKVYGTAPSGSAVTIYDGDTAIARINVANRYFNKQISLAEGTHNLRITALKEAVTAQSSVVVVEAVADAPEISNIRYTEGYLSTPVTGIYPFPTFSTYVLLNYATNEYLGMYDISGSFDISNLGNYTVKGVSFAGASVNPANSGSKYSFTFAKNTWGGTGVAPVIVTLEKDGVEYSFTIALVTMFIDPSGYVYDAVTGLPVEGATVTLEVKKDSSWVEWVDPDGLQANPQTTNEEGKYGWFVPNGEYRVKVSAENYSDAIANMADGSYNAESPDGFPVPPEQTEVNIPLSYNGGITAEAAWVDGELVVTFNRPFNGDLGEIVIVTVGGTEVEGAWSTGDGMVFKFAPGTAFTAGSSISISVEPSAQSSDGIAIGSIAALTVSVPGGGGGSSSGGGGGGGGPVAATPKASIPSGKVAKGTAVSLTTETEGAQIYYTLSGTTPTSNSTLYSEPVIINEKTTIKAIAAKAGLGNSSVLTVTYEILDDSAMKFTDVNSTDWFYNAVCFVAEKGITQGVSENSYDPQGMVTRGQFITMLCRAYGIAEMSGDNFADAGNTWYTGYLAAAKQLGISNGIGDDMFGPDMQVTREQMVVLIYNYMVSIGEGPEGEWAVNLEYADVDQISDWAVDGVMFGTIKQWVKGKDNNMFDPLGNATRAELAQIFFNIFSAE